MSTRRVIADGRVVGVQRREHQVAGQRRLHGDLGGLLVADLADQDHVRRLAQHGAQDARERQADAALHLALVDAADVELDRVLGGDDLDVGAVELLQRRVERRGLAGAGRAGDQHDAVRARDHALETLAVVPSKPSACRLIRPRSLSSRRITIGLAVAARQHRGADVDVAALDPERDAAVLRLALLGDVEAGHDLQPRGQRRQQGGSSDAISFSTPSMR
jgi:hypothetical protein